MDKQKISGTPDLDQNRGCLFLICKLYHQWLEMHIILNHWWHNLQLRISTPPPIMIIIGGGSKVALKPRDFNKWCYYTNHIFIWPIYIFCIIFGSLGRIAGNLLNFSVTKMSKMAIFWCFFGKFLEILHHTQKILTGFYLFFLTKFLNSVKFFLRQLVY